MSSENFMSFDNADSIIGDFADSIIKSLKRKAISPANYNGMLSNLNESCYFSFSNPDIAYPWVDTPENVNAGIIMNYVYADQYELQICVSYPAMDWHMRTVNIITKLPNENWVSSKPGGGTVYYALGDSITNGGFSTEAGNSYSGLNGEWCYPKQIGRMYGCKVVNLSANGATIAGTGVSLSAQVVNIQSDATLITITGGANDYGNGTEIGSISDTGKTTIIGALKYVVETAAARAPLARIVLISPWIIKQGTLATKWSLNYKYSKFTYEELCQAMKTVAEYYNIEFIDGTHNGPVNTLNIGEVEKDNVHPTKAFYKTISQWVGSKLF